MDDAEIRLHACETNYGNSMAAGHTAAEGMDTVQNESDYEVCNNSSKEENVSSQTDDTHHQWKNVPIDRGWAWVILIGAMVVNFLLIGVLKCSGIFFVQFQERFKSSSSMTSLISSVQMATISILSLFIMTAGMKYMTCRTSVFIGGILLGMSFIVTAVAEHIVTVIIAQGVLFGAAFSFSQGPTIAFLGQHFKRWRGLANSMALSSCSLGGLVFAPLSVTLFEHYAYTGAFLVIAGMMFNVSAVAILYRPLSSYSVVKCRKRTNGGFVNTGRSTKPLLSNHKNSSVEDTKSGECTSQSSAIARELNLVTNTSVRSITETSSVSSSLSYHLAALSSSSLATVARSDRLNSIPSLFENQNQKQICDTSTTNEDANHNEFDCTAMKRILMSTFDFHLLKNPVFIVFLLFISFMDSSLVLLTVFIAPHAKEVGATDQQISTLFILITSLDLVFRILSGVLADRTSLSRAYIISISTAVTGVACQFAPLYHSITSVIIFSTIFSIFSAAYFSLFAVVISDFFGVENLQSSLGFTIVCIGVSGGAFFPIVGLLRDATGSYTASFHFLGSLVLAGSACAAVANILHRRKAAK